MLKPTLLPEEVREALSQGNTVEAIKRLRASTGLGLKEAKDAVDGHLRHSSMIGAQFGTQPATAGAMPASVVDALASGNKIEAIKLFRDQAGVGLKEAKDAVDAYEHEMNAGENALAPGEVPRSGSLVRLLGAVACIGILWYVLSHYFFA